MNVNHNMAIILTNVNETVIIIKVMVQSLFYLKVEVDKILTLWWTKHIILLSNI